MAICFSPATSVRSIQQHNVLSPSVNCKAIGGNVVSWNSAGHYGRLNDGFRRISCKPLVVKHSSPRRNGLLRCATIEEIEAEKSSIEKDVKDRMEKTLETVRSNFNSIRTGRANPSMLDWVEAIEKAIVSSDLGLTPNNDGEVIRLSIPQLMSERRKELSKVVAKQAEEGKVHSNLFLGHWRKVALRNIRRDAIKAYEKLEKEKKLSEDNVKDLSSDLQKVTDEYIKKIEFIYKQKEKALHLFLPRAVESLANLVCAHM